MNTLYYLLAGLAAANIVCLVARHFTHKELKSIDGVSCVVKKSDCHGNVVTGIGD